MKYDVKPYKDEKTNGFYTWNKPTFFVEKNDERYDEMVKEKKETGISSDETWDLKTNIAVFIVPRLKLLKEKQSSIKGYPMCFNNAKEWYEVLDKMIVAFESHLKDDFYIPKKYFKKYPKNDLERNTKARNDYWNDIAEGLNLFAKYYSCLWW